MPYFEYSAKNPGAPVAFASFTAMNTVCEIVIAAAAERTARTVACEIERLAADVEKMFSRHIPQSVISEINRNASRQGVTTGRETAAVLELCERFRRATCGYFDIAALSADRGRPAYFPDPESRSVTTRSEDIVLDLGGFAKGYLLDKARPLFESEAVKSALVNLGNSSVMAVGSHPLGENWQVGITRAGPPGEAVTFSLRDMALSVSGKSPAGKAHIVDPVTGQYPSSDEMLAVEGRSPVVCEILSTALYAAPARMREDIISSFGGYKAYTIDATGKKTSISV